MVSARGAFALVEAVVALTLLGIAAAASGAASSWASRRILDARATEEAAAAAELVLDSLVATPSPASGSTRLDGCDLAWTVAGDGGARRIELRVRVRGAEERELLFEADPGAVLPVLDGAP